MSRPRLEAEQRKVSFSLAFSPNLIAALEKVRGARSQSVFVEEWLRQQPQIAAELVAMNDPGFDPPVIRYEQLMALLLAFYSPAGGKRSTLARTLFIAHKVIIKNQVDTEASLEEQITAAMEEFWMQQRRTDGTRTACGENLEAARPAIKEYARYYIRVIFQEMAKGDRVLLQHRFRGLVKGCEAAYQARVQKQQSTAANK